jgi:hypothetical protein
MDEPHLDLASFLVPPAPGGDSHTKVVRLATHEDLGRIVIATVPYDDIGRPILRERPLLSWSRGSSNLFNAFLEAPSHVKDIVLDMFTPPANSTLMLQAAAIAGTCAVTYPRASTLGRETMTKLIGVEMANAHAYYGREDLQYFEHIGGPTGAERSALFAYGSKVAHSCLPNVAYNSKTSDGCLEYQVIRPINVGDMITMSYVGELFSSSTIDRRKKLWESKCFFCKCPRRMGPDNCRLSRCPMANCMEYVRCTYDVTETQQRIESSSSPGSSSEVWECPSCGILAAVNASSIARKEQKIRSRIERFEETLRRPSGLSAVLPVDIQKLYRSAAKDELNPVHHLTLKVLQLTAQVCASHAVGIEGATSAGMLPRNARTPFGTSSQLRLQAAVAGFQYVSGCECVAAECHGCTVAIRNHSPLYEQVAEILHAWQDLKHVPNSRWPAYVSEVYLQPYLPLFYANYGPRDSDAQDIERYLRTSGKSRTGIKEATCDNCKQPSVLPLQLCSRCKKARYCSKQCQIAAWGTGHKVACKKV